MKTSSTGEAFSAGIFLFDRKTGRFICDAWAILGGKHPDARSALDAAESLARASFGPLYDRVVSILVTAAPTSIVGGVRWDSLDWLTGRGMLADGSDLSYPNVCALLGVQARGLNRPKRHADAA